jgi:parallel beta-helix repeat protein
MVGERRGAMRRILGLTVVVALLQIPVSAGASNGLECGDVVTESVSLTHDLINCPGDGLVVGANGITIDLAGHTIDGAGAGAGVRVPPGSVDVTVTNGTITQFAEGVTLDTTTGNTVSRLNVAANNRGINLANASANLVEKNAVTTSVDGIRVNGAGSDANVVRQNVVQSSVFGITVSDGADENLVDQNEVSGGNIGIALFSAAQDTEVTRNEVFGNAVSGIQVQSSSNDALVSQNMVHDNGEGILVDVGVSGVVVSRNEVIANAGDGIEIRGSNNLVERNVIVDNGGFGIHLTATSSNNTVRRNDLEGNSLGPILDAGTGNSVTS